MVDDIFVEDGVSITGIQGGAGTYALAGASLWSDRVYLAAKTNKTQGRKLQRWFEKNNFPQDYLEIIDHQSPVNRIAYYKDGTKVEKQQLARDEFKHFEYTSTDFTHQARQECGLYIFKNAAADFWTPYLQLKDRQATVLWRVARDACQKTYLDQVKLIAQSVDIVSINYNEAKFLFDTCSLEEILAGLHDFKTPLIVLTEVNGGMMFLRYRSQIHIPHTNENDVVDLTGADDGVSGAVLVGYTQGKNIHKIAFMANHSRTLNVAQYGLPDSIYDYKVRNFL